MSPSESVAGASLHVAIRFSDELYSVGDTIGKHVEVIERAGAVWLGKFGKPLAPQRIRTINEQVASGTSSYLYLVRKRAGSRGYDAFRGQLLRVSRDEEEVDRRLVPAYYDLRSLWGVVGFWAKLSTIDPLPADGLAQLRVLRSNVPLPESLRTSVAGMFIVGRRDALDRT